MVAEEDRRRKTNRGAMIHHVLWKSLAIIAVGLTTLMACGGSRRALSSKEPVKVESKESFISQLKDHQLLPTYFNARAKIRYDDGDTRVSFNSQIRLKQDEYIWVTASMLAYEVARILIRPDSIFALNRWDKTYIADSYEGFNNEYEIPATFSQLQQMIVGNSAVDLSHVFTIENEDSVYDIKQSIESIELLEKIDASQFKPLEVLVSDERSNYSLECMYREYRKTIQSEDFSYFRQYIIKYHNAQVASIQINFQNIDKSSKKVPFEIPGHYKPFD